MLNRTCIPNRPQLGINEMSAVKCIAIDVFGFLNRLFPVDYGDQPFWVCPNKKLKRYLARYAEHIPGYLLHDWIKDFWGVMIYYLQKAHGKVHSHITIWN